MDEMNNASAEFRDGWKTLTGAMIGLAVGVHALPFGTSGLFLGPLTSTFGWTRAEVSLGSTLLFLCIGAIAPFMGLIIDRFGAKRVILPGLSCLCLFFLAMSRISSSLPLYYALFIGVGVLAAGSATPTYTRIINTRFAVARGRALGISLIGTGLSSATIPPILATIISSYGWRAGYVTLAIIVALATPFILLLLGSSQRSTDESQSLPGSTIHEALADRMLWGLGIVFFLVALAVGGFSSHFIAMLTDQGVSAITGARLMGAGGFFLIFGRLLTGFLIDRFFAPRVAAIVMLVSAGGFLLIAQGGATFAVAGLLAAGLAFGAEIDLVSYLVARYFGLRAYGRVYGVLYAFVVAGTALSPTAYGLCFDLLGSYVAVLEGAAGMLVIASIGFSLLRAFPERFQSLPPRASIVPRGYRA